MASRDARHDHGEEVVPRASRTFFEAQGPERDFEMNKEMSKLMNFLVVLTALMGIATMVVGGFVVRNLLSTISTLRTLAE